jgi:hypothetical protein
MGPRRKKAKPVPAMSTFTSLISYITKSKSNNNKEKIDTKDDFRRPLQSS